MTESKAPGIHAPDITAPGITKPDLSHPVGLSALADAIVAHHHRYARQHGPVIYAQLHDLARLSGQRDLRLKTLLGVFEHLHSETVLHMHQEEKQLFPFCHRLEQPDALRELLHSLPPNPLQQMSQEHRHTEEQLELIRRLTDDFMPPDWADAGHRRVYELLQEYCSDLQQHQSLEDDFLFPAVRRRIAELAAAAEAARTD